MTQHDVDLSSEAREAPTTELPSDGFTDSTADLAECARMNFDNIADLAPPLRSSPMWMIAMQQLEAVCARLRHPPLVQSIEFPGIATINPDGTIYIKGPVTIRRAG